MSTFGETLLRNKFAELTQSQESIQTLSLWIIHHRKHYVLIVKAWLQELFEVSEERKLTIMYLANDIIQNSKRKGPEYSLEFSTVLPIAFSHIGKDCTLQILRRSISRMLQIWDERGVYSADDIADYRARLNSGNWETELYHPNEYIENQQQSRRAEKRKHEEDNWEYTSADSFSDTGEEDDEEAIQMAIADEQRRVGGEHIDRDLDLGEEPVLNESSDTFLYGLSPEPIDLISVMVDIEHTNSEDADIREQVANLRDFTSTTSGIYMLQDKEAAESLRDDVIEAVELLHEFNGRLINQLDKRKRYYGMLYACIAEQEKLIHEFQQRYDENREKLEIFTHCQQEIEDHLSSFPN